MKATFSIAIVVFAVWGGAYGCLLFDAGSSDVQVHDDNWDATSNWLSSKRNEILFQGRRFVAVSPAFTATAAGV